MVCEFFGQSVVVTAYEAFEAVAYEVWQYCFPMCNATGMPNPITALKSGIAFAMLGAAGVGSMTWAPNHRSGEKR